MGRPITNHSPAHTRNRARYNVLVAIGARPITKATYTSPIRFYAALKERGIDPSQYPDLVEYRTGGQPFRGVKVADRERYHRLRALGASPEFANAWSKSDTSFEIAVRKLALGMGKEP